MSKLYEKYLSKKNKNPDKLLMFKSGKFYIFLGDDAKKMSEELNLKLTKFSSLTDKCGFPVNRLDTYKKFIELLKYDYEIVLNTVDYIINDINNSNDITKEEAYNKIMKYKEMLTVNE